MSANQAKRRPSARKAHTPTLKAQESLPLTTAPEINPLPPGEEDLTDSELIAEDIAPPPKKPHRRAKSVTPPVTSRARRSGQKTASDQALTANAPLEPEPVPAPEPTPEPEPEPKPAPKRRGGRKKAIEPPPINEDALGASASSEMDPEPEPTLEPEPTPEPEPKPAPKRRGGRKKAAEPLPVSEDIFGSSASNELDLAPSPAEGSNPSIYNQDSFIQDSFNQDSFIQDSSIQDSFIQDSLSQDSLSQDSFNPANSDPAVFDPASPILSSVTDSLVAVAPPRLELPLTETIPPALTNETWAESVPSGPSPLTPKPTELEAFFQSLKGEPKSPLDEDSPKTSSLNQSDDLAAQSNELAAQPFASPPTVSPNGPTVSSGLNYTFNVNEILQRNARDLKAPPNFLEELRLRFPSKGVPDPDEDLNDSPNDLTPTPGQTAQEPFLAAPPSDPEDNYEEFDNVEDFGEDFKDDLKNALEDYQDLDCVEDEDEAWRETLTAPNSNPFPLDASASNASSPDPPPFLSAPYSFKKEPLDPIQLATSDLLERHPLSRGLNLGSTPPPMDPPFGPREGATRGPTDPPTSTPRPGHPGAGSPTPLDRSLSESELIEKLGQAPRVESLPTLSIRWRLIQQKKLLKIAYILSLGFVFLAAAASYLAIFPLEPRYFWVTPELRVMETTPLSESFISTASLVNWTARSLKEAFSLDYLHVDERLAKLKDNFSDTARTLLVEYLKNNGHLNKIINDRLVMASELTGAPVIVETRQGNPLTWVLEAPFTISYHSSTGSVSSRKVLATVEIQRVKTSQNPRGVEISRLTLSPVGAP